MKGTQNDTGSEEGSRLAQAWRIMPRALKVLLALVLVSLVKIAKEYSGGDSHG